MGMRPASRALVAVGMIAYGLAGAIGCWLMVTPKWYTARVLGELGPPNSGVVGELARGAQGLGSQPLSQEEHVSLEASTEMLGQVVEERQLVVRWNLPGSAEAVAKLRSMLRIATEPGTDLIKLEIASTDPREAAGLANDVGAAFFRHGETRGTIHEMATVPRHYSAPNIRGWSLIAGLLAALGMGALTAAWAMVRRKPVGIDGA